MGDYNYNTDDYYDEVYDRSQLALDRMFSPREEQFDFTSLGAYLNFKLLNDKIQNREPSILDKLLSGDEDHELEEEYEADPNQKLITFFRFSFPQSPNEDEMLTTTSSPFDPPKFFTIIKFTFNPDTSDYDHEQSESEWGLGMGDFDEDRQESSFDMASQSGEPWKIYDSRLKYDDYDYIDSSSDMMVAHFPLHYILVCLGFSLMIALLFMTRRRQIARQRHMATMGQATTTTTDVKIVIGNDLVKCDAPPAYDDAIKLPKEKEDEMMLPKYTEK